MKNHSRREFLKEAGTLSAAGLLLSSIPFTSCIAQDKKKLGVALVGLGNYSTTMLSKVLKETSLCYLSSIVTGSPSKAEWSKQYNISAKNIYNYSNFKNIVSNKDVDIAYIVLPNSMHSEYTIKALEAGKHVICEKPMAMDAAEAMQMIKKSKSKIVDWLQDALRSIFYRSKKAWPT